MKRLLLIAGIACLLGAQTPNSSGDHESRISKLEVQVSDQKDQLLLLTTKLDKINDSLVELKTKMTLIQWIGGALGLLVLSSVWKLLWDSHTSTRTASFVDDAGRIVRLREVAGVPGFSFSYRGDHGHGEEGQKKEDNAGRATGRV